MSLKFNLFGSVIDLEKVLSENEINFENVIIKSEEDIETYLENKFEPLDTIKTFKYSELEKKVTMLGGDINRSMFKHYISDGLIHDGIKKNPKLTLYDVSHVLKCLVIYEIKQIYNLDFLKRIIRYLDSKEDDKEYSLINIYALFYSQILQSKILSQFIIRSMKDENDISELSDIDLFLSHSISVIGLKDAYGIGEISDED